MDYEIYLRGYIYPFGPLLWLGWGVLDRTPVTSLCSDEETFTDELPCSEVVDFTIGFNRERVIEKLSQKLKRRAQND